MFLFTGTAPSSAPTNWQLSNVELRYKIVDMGGNINLFGKIETMKIQQDEQGRYAIWNNNRQLTNVPFQK